MVGGAFGVVRVIILENNHRPNRAQPAANVVAFTGTTAGCADSSRTRVTRHDPQEEADRLAHSLPCSRVPDLRGGQRHGRHRGGGARASRADRGACTAAGPNERGSAPDKRPSKPRSGETGKAWRSP